MIDDQAYSEKINDFRKKMLQAMKQYNDPAFEAFRDRYKKGSTEEFMKLQDEKAKKTKPDVKF
jgi:hypothetical protein